MAGTTAWAVHEQMASFSTRKKIERNNTSFLDHNLQVRVVGKTHHQGFHVIPVLHLHLLF